MLFMLLEILVSCDDLRIYDQYQTVAGTWKSDKKIEFVLPELDSLNNYNLFITIRNNNEYQYSNLFLISAMKFPNGKVVTDTLEYTMAMPDGQWLGSGFTDIKENKLFYKENVRFLEKGNYQVVLQHAMRKSGEVGGINSLKGIMDVGFRIEPTPKPDGL